MHEYIEWDNREKKFKTPMCGCGITINDFFDFYENSETFSIHKYIGKVDVNKKLIYENSSIVKISLFHKKSKNEIKGFFVYDNSALCYVIWDLEKEDFIDYDIKNMLYFEIIDTIQENKLNLI